MTQTCHRPQTRVCPRAASVRQCCLVAAALVVCCTLQTQASVLDDFLAAASKGGAYQPPARAELKQAETLFEQTLAATGAQASSSEGGGADYAALQSAWAELHYRLAVVRDEASAGAAPAAPTAVILVEEDGYKKGRGLYWLRAAPACPGGEARPWLLQAPHSFKDLDTREIALSMAAEGPFVAAAWNTVPREQEDDNESADMAHLTDTYFNRFTSAFAQRYPAGYVVQLHGFAQDKRQSKPGESADIIVSCGSEQPRAYLSEVDACLETELKTVDGADSGLEVRMFPGEVDELGGTTNAQGKLLRQMGCNGFLHVEMSREARQTLLGSREARKKFLRCLEEHLQ